MLDLIDCAHYHRASSKGVCCTVSVVASEPAASSQVTLFLTTSSCLEPAQGNAKFNLRSMRTPRSTRTSPTWADLCNLNVIERRRGLNKHRPNIQILLCLSQRRSYRTDQLVDQLISALFSQEIENQNI